MAFERTNDDYCHQGAWHWEASICWEEEGKTLEEVTFAMGSSLGGEEGQVFQEKEGHKDREEWIPIGC